MTADHAERSVSDEFKAGAAEQFMEQWDLAGHLGPKAGQPEFVTMSPDGESVVGVTCEEYEVWFVAVAPFGEWLEAWARGWAAERPEEREAGWDTVLRRKKGSARLWGVWRDGLPRNPAAPAAVLRRLLDVGPEERLPSGLNHWELPEDVVAAWVAHPEWRSPRRRSPSSPPTPIRAYAPN
ncbi:hypothetical protein ACPCIU_13710 [Streptomyces seoulensis]|uniref:hypothetical protein n=1 Tax=Streptomyces seoulensis TaxID=73044 RepID=UPI003C309618